jgi:hypothetical protein
MQEGHPIAFESKKQRGGGLIEMAKSWKKVVFSIELFKGKATLFRLS